MIGKLIPNPDAGASKSVRVSGLLRYIAQPERDDGGEKCVRYGARNFLSHNFNGHILEMIELASAATRSADPIEHFMLSWPEGEQPTAAQAEAAVDMLIHHMCLDEHQAAWGLHADTDTLHLHLIVNRVHPVTEKPVKINKGFTKEALHQALSMIENAQGWAPQEGARYEVDARGAPLRRQVSNDPALSVQACAFETRTGEASAQRIAQEVVPEIVAHAASWGDFHRSMAQAGLRYERKGSGALIWVGDQPVKASAAARGASLSKLQKRLGPFEPNDQESPNVYISHEAAEPHLGRIGELTGYGLRNLSECHLAHHNGRPVAGVLSLDARTYRSGYEGLRRPPRSKESNLTGVSDRAPEPVAPHASRGWNEYRAEKDNFFTERKRAQERTKIEHQSRRVELRNRHRVERNEIFRGSWKGRGIILNALRSVTAAQQASELAALKDREHEERAALRANYGTSFPDYETWLRTNAGDLAAQVWRHRDGVDEAILGSSDPNAPVNPVRPLDIRDCRSRRTADGTAYTLRGNFFASFVDTGKTIVIRRRDDASVAAALQLAQQKFGPVQIQLPFFSLGRRKFEAQCVRLAAEHQIRLADPKLQEQVRRHRTESELQIRATAKTRQVREFERYAQAVDAERYRVTSLRSLPGGQEQGFIVGEHRGARAGLVPSQVVSNIPHMMALAGTGESLRYEPISDRKHHIVIDGLTSLQRDRLLADGYMPCAIIQTKPDEFQAVLTIEKLGTKRDARVASQLAERLNHEYGDATAHAFASHAPGFANRSALRHDTNVLPTEVLLTFAERRTCRKTSERAQELDDELVQNNHRRKIENTQSGMDGHSAIGGTKQDAAAAQVYFAHRADILDRQSGPVDPSRIDFMIAQRMRVTGHSRNAIRVAILNGASKSRPTDAPAVNWDAYATRTTNAVFAPTLDKKLPDLAAYEERWRRLEGRRPESNKTRSIGRAPVGQ